jgi:hypothetical protein
VHAACWRVNAAFVRGVDDGGLPWAVEERCGMTYFFLFVAEAQRHLSRQRRATEMRVKFGGIAHPSSVHVMFAAAEDICP